MGTPQREPLRELGEEEVYANPGHLFFLVQRSYLCLWYGLSYRTSRVNSGGSRWRRPNRIEVGQRLSTKDDGPAPMSMMAPSR